MTEQQTKVIVVFSGGLDSTVGLYQAVELYGKENVGAISFHYGQRHLRELDAAGRIAAELGVAWGIIEVPRIFGAANSPLTNPDVPMAAGDDPAGTIVPYRNGTLLSLATALAVVEEASVVIFCGHHDDAPYPDCTPDFVVAQGQAIAVGTGGTVSLSAPFVHKTKAQIVAIGDNLKVPFELTWSCYEGGEHHCGQCPTCVGRQQAFWQASVDDPTVYDVTNQGSAQ